MDVDDLPGDDDVEGLLGLHAEVMGDPVAREELAREGVELLGALEGYDDDDPLPERYSGYFVSAGGVELRTVGDVREVLQRWLGEAHARSVAPMN